MSDINDLPYMNNSVHRKLVQDLELCFDISVSESGDTHIDIDLWGNDDMEPVISTSPSLVEMVRDYFVTVEFDHEPSDAIMRLTALKEDLIAISKMVGDQIEILEAV